RRAGPFFVLGGWVHARLWPAVADRIGRDHARRRHHEHRLVVAVAEDVNVVGALYLGGRERGRRGLLSVGHHSQARRDQDDDGDDGSQSRHTIAPSLEVVFSALKSVLGTGDAGGSIAGGAAEVKPIAQGDAFV